MEDNFRVRVDRAFGMLSATASADVSPALWCLTDEEIERREWNRNKDAEVEIEKELNRNDFVISRTFISESQLESDLQEPSDNEDDEEEPENEEDVNAEKSVRRCGGDAADEFLDVRANMGRDCTLDEEEEEDEYDKVAIGKDHNGDCLYMRDVKYAYYEIEESTVQSELPNSFESTFRDPRANHEAANARLKEDAEASGGFDTLQLSDVSITTHTQTDTMSVDHYSEAELDVDKLKPILKKRDDLKDSESLTHVRFTVDPSSITEMNDEQHLSRAGGDLISTINNSALCEQTSEVSGYSSSVPDYMKNPSRYVHYTFDSTKDVDDLSNRNAYMDFFNSPRRKKSGDNDSSYDDEHVSAEIPISIVFTPRKKSEGDTTMKNESYNERKHSDAKNKGPSLVAEDEAEEVSAMEVDDEAHAAVNEGFTLQKSSGRKYRTRTGSDADDDTHMHG